MPMKIAILEDNAERQELMQSCLKDRFHQYEACFFDEAPAMIDFLEEHLCETIAISLDHDLEMKPGSPGTWIDPGTGRDVADFLTQKSPSCHVVIHTTNSPAAVGMEMALRESHWKTHRVIPFDDLNWIETDWFRTLRRAIFQMARPAQKP